MKNIYESPIITVVAIVAEGAFLSTSSNVEGTGIKDLTYEDIQWN